MGIARSQQFGLPGNNRIWITIEWDDTSSGGKNSMNVRMRVSTKYRINGTWTCRLKVNGSMLGYERKTMRWGSNSSGGSREVFNCRYSGGQKVNVEASILSMDYYSVALGPGSMSTKTLTYNTSISLKSANRPPYTAALYCKNYLVNHRFIGEDTFDFQVGPVIDPDGDKVKYAVYMDSMVPGTSKWSPVGGGIGLIHFDYTNKFSYNIASFPRGTRFRANARCSDKYGAASYFSDIVDNLYRNQLPPKPRCIYPAGGAVSGDKFRIWWDATDVDSDMEDVRYDLWCRRDKGDWNKYWTYKKTNESWERIADDPEGTTYEYKLCANDGLTLSEPIMSSTFIKSTKPMSPTNILPNSGYYVKDVMITWDKLSDPSGSPMDHYEVFINDKKIGESSTNSLQWSIPDECKPGTEMTVSIIAYSRLLKPSDKGVAMGAFKKAYPPDAPKWIRPNDTYHESEIDLTWEEIESNGIRCRYEIEYMVDGGAWNPLVCDLQNAYYNYSLQNISRNSSVQFRIRAINSFGVRSEFAYSSKFFRNSRPERPIIDFPQNNSTIYTNNPEIGISFFEKSNGQAQTIIVEVDGVEYTSSGNYNMFSKTDGSFTQGGCVIFQSDELSNGSHVISVYSNDGLTNSQRSTSTIYIDNIEKRYEVGEEIRADIINYYIDATMNLRYAYNLTQTSIRRANKNDYIDHIIIKNIQDSIEEIAQKINNYDSNNDKFYISYNLTKVGKDIISTLYFNEILTLMEVL